MMFRRKSFFSLFVLLNFIYYTSASETCIATAVGLDNGEVLQVGAPYYISSSPHGGVVFSSDSGGVKSILRILKSNVLQLVAGVPGNYDATSLSGSIAATSVVDVYSLIAVPDSTEIYFTDSSCVFKITKEGFIELVAGKPNQVGYFGDGGDAKSALLNNPSGLAYSTDSKDLYISDAKNHIVRKVSSSGIITTIAGKNNTAGYNGDNGLATSALLNNPNALAISSKTGDLFIADTNSNVIRMVSKSTGIITTLAGNNNTGSLLGDTGKATSAAIQVGGYVGGQIAIDQTSSVLYIVDTSLIVRAVNLATGDSSLIAGNRNRAKAGDGSAADKASFDPASVTVDSTGNLWIADNYFNSIRIVSLSTKIITSFSIASTDTSNTNIKNAIKGSKLASYAVALNYNEGLAISSDNTIYVSDTWNNAIYKMNSMSEITIIAGTSGTSGFEGEGVQATNAKLSFPTGIVVSSSGIVYFSDSSNNVIRTISSTGIISTLSGSKSGGFNNGPAKNALFSYPSGLALNGTDLYVADYSNRVVRLITGITGTSPIVSTFAGNAALTSSSGDNGPATSAGIKVYGEIALCESGTILYIADESKILRRVDVTSKIITTVIGSLSGASFQSNCGMEGLATSSSLTIFGVACNSNNVLYVSGKCNNRGSVIAKVDGSLIKLVAGSTSISGYVDSPFALSKGLIGEPQSITFDSSGALFISDMTNNVVRMLQLDSTNILCPSGFYCSCGRNPAPCVSSSSFCPKNSKKPFQVSDGYLSTSIFSPFEVDRGLQIYTSQLNCPVGFYCSNGTRLPCPGGTFGVFTQQSAVQSCTACAAGTYLSDTGVGSMTYQMSSPCKTCPIGSVSQSARSKYCVYCSPGTYRDDTLKECNKCPIGSTSLFGSISCFKSEETDGLRVQPETMIFQRRRDVLDNNKSPSEVLVATLGSIIPVVLFFAIPYIIAILARSHCFPHDMNQMILTKLESIDLYAIRAPHTEGDSPKKLPTAHGGAMYILVVGLVLAPIISTYISYSLTNTQVVVSLRPLTLPKLTAFQELTYNSATAFVNDSSIRPLLSSGSASGFAVLIKTMGSKCGQIKSFTPNLHAGSFSNSSMFSISSGLAEHSFICSKCTLDELSTLSVQFDATCQSFSVTMSAVGVGGGISSSTMNLSPPRSDSVLESASGTFIVSLEVIQDTINGNQPRKDGLILGGRSAMGLLLLAASDLSTTERVSSENSDETMTLNLRLEQRGDFVEYDLIPLMTVLQLLTAMSSWLPFIASGITLLYIHEAFVLKIWGPRALPHLDHLQNDVDPHEGERKERAIAAASISLAAAGNTISSSGEHGGGTGSIHVIRRSISAGRVIQQFKMNALLKQNTARSIHDPPMEEERVAKDEIISVHNGMLTTDGGTPSKAASAISKLAQSVKKPTPPPSRMASLSTPSRTTSMMSDTPPPPLV